MNRCVHMIVCVLCSVYKCKKVNVLFFYLLLLSSV